MVIICRNEKVIALCGNGYGKSEIIEYALKNSGLLKEATYFWTIGLNKNK